METTKETAKRTKRIKHEPILTTEATVKFGQPDAYSEKAYPKETTEITVNATEQSTQPETQAQPPQQNPTKPLFESETTAFYRELLLERPVLKTITNIQEAITFAERYEKWNRKVQQLFK